MSLIRFRLIRTHDRFILTTTDQITDQEAVDIQGAWENWRMREGLLVIPECDYVEIDTDLHLVIPDPVR